MWTCLGLDSTAVVSVNGLVDAGGWDDGSMGFGHESSGGLVGMLVSLCVPQVEVEQPVLVETVSAET